MKGFILDSDTWIEFFRHRGGVDKHIAETPAEQIFASEVSLAEHTYGALHSSAVEKHLQEPKEIESTFTVLPLGDWIRDYAEIRQSLTKKGLMDSYPTSCLTRACSDYGRSRRFQPILKDEVYLHKFQFNEQYKRGHMASLIEYLM